MWEQPPQERPDLDEEGPAGGYAEVGRHLFNRDLWGILALVGLALWALEWGLYHRRITE